MTGMLPLLSPRYPTPQHERAAEVAVEFLAASAIGEAVLLCASCARGAASPDSDVDLAVLVRPDVPADERRALARAWGAFVAQEPIFAALAAAGKYAHVGLEITTGEFAPQGRGWTSGPDAFELEIGNYLAYSIPLWQRDGRSSYLAELRARWLPYYDEELRAVRLAEVRKFCINNLDHIPLYVARGLYFQSFDRLWKAFQEFLQALFIARRTYPIAYDKWVREQVEGILGLPELYRQLPHLFEIQRFESDELAEKAAALRRLLDQYAPAE